MKSAKIRAFFVKKPFVTQMLMNEREIYQNILPDFTLLHLQVEDS